MSAGAARVSATGDDADVKKFAVELSDLGHLPEEARAMFAKLDHDGSNSVEPCEVVAMVSAYEAVRKQHRLLRMIAIAFAVALTGIMACIFGMSFAVAELSKEADVSADGVMTARSGGQAVAAAHPHLSTMGVPTTEGQIANASGSRSGASRLLMGLSGSEDGLVDLLVDPKSGSTLETETVTFEETCFTKTVLYMNEAQLADVGKIAVEDEDTGAEIMLQVVEAERKNIARPDLNATYSIATVWMKTSSMINPHIVFVGVYAAGDDALSGDEPYDVTTVIVDSVGEVEAIMTDLAESLEADPSAYSDGSLGGSRRLLFFKKFIKKVGKKIKKKVKTLAKSPIAKSFKKAIKKAAEVGESVIDYVAEVVEDVAEFVGDAVDALLEIFGLDIDEIKEKIKDWILNELLPGLSIVRDKIRENIADTLSNFCLLQCNRDDEPILDVNFNDLFNTDGEDSWFDGADNWRRLLAEAPGPTARRPQLARNFSSMRDVQGTTVIQRGFSHFVPEPSEFVAEWAQLATDLGPALDWGADAAVGGGWARQPAQATAVVDAADATRAFLDAPCRRGDGSLECVSAAWVYASSVNWTLLVRAFTPEHVYFNDDEVATCNEVRWAEAYSNSVNHGKHTPLRRLVWECMDGAREETDARTECAAYKRRFVPTVVPNDEFVTRYAGINSLLGSVSNVGVGADANATLATGEPCGQSSPARRMLGPEIAARLHMLIPLPVLDTAGGQISAFKRVSVPGAGELHRTIAYDSGGDADCAPNGRKAPYNATGSKCRALDEGVGSRNRAWATVEAETRKYRVSYPHMGQLMSAMRHTFGQYVRRWTREERGASSASPRASWASEGAAAARRRLLQGDDAVDDEGEEEYEDLSEYEFEYSDLTLELDLPVCFKLAEFELDTSELKEAMHDFLSSVPLIQKLFDTLASFDFTDILESNDRRRLLAGGRGLLDARPDVAAALRAVASNELAEHLPQERRRRMSRSLAENGEDSGLFDFVKVTKLKARIDILPKLMLLGGGRNYLQTWDLRPHISDSLPVTAEAKYMIPYPPLAWIGFAASFDFDVTELLAQVKLNIDDLEMIIPLDGLWMDIDLLTGIVSGGRVHVTGPKLPFTQASAQFSAGIQVSGNVAICILTECLGPTFAMDAKFAIGADLAVGREAELRKGFHTVGGNAYDDPIVLGSCTDGNYTLRAGTYVSLDFTFMLGLKWKGAVAEALDKVGATLKQKMQGVLANSKPVAFVGETAAKLDLASKFPILGDLKPRLPICPFGVDVLGALADPAAALADVASDLIDTGATLLDAAKNFLEDGVQLGPFTLFDLSLSFCTDLPDVEDKKFFLDGKPESAGTLWKINLVDAAKTGNVIILSDETIADTNQLPIKPPPDTYFEELTTPEWLSTNCIKYGDPWGVECPNGLVMGHVVGSSESCGANGAYKLLVGCVRPGGVRSGGADVQSQRRYAEVSGCAAPATLAAAGGTLSGSTCSEGEYLAGVWSGSTPPSDCAEGEYTARAACATARSCGGNLAAAWNFGFEPVCKSESATYASLGEAQISCAAGSALSSLSASPSGAGGVVVDWSCCSVSVEGPDGIMCDKSFSDCDEAVLQEAFRHEFASCQDLNTAMRGFTARSEGFADLESLNCCNAAIPAPEEDADEIDPELDETRPIEYDIVYVRC